MTEVRSEMAERYQRIVNETQLPRLNKMIAVLDDEILDTPQQFTYVVIDNLDRDWVDEQLANDLIRCLFRATLDLVRVRNLKVVVALRTNILEHLNFGGRTGGQEEKFRALSRHVHWTRSELEALADERVRVAGERWGLGDVEHIKDLLPAATQTRGRPLDFIFDRTLMRPRDLIAFLNECISNAIGKTRLSWTDLQRSEVGYSGERLLALRDEWKPTFPDIDKVFDLFRGCPEEMSRDEFTPLLDQAALLPASASFAGVIWMTELTEPLWSGIGVQEWPDLYQPLVKLLYDVSFIGLRTVDTRVHFSYEDAGYADLQSNLGPGSRFLVHPAFWAALDILRRRR
jgi:hypothetical protein